MVSFHPGLHQTATISYTPTHESIQLVFTARQGDTEHLELWTDLPDGEWKAIPFIVETPQAVKDAKELSQDDDDNDQTVVMISTELDPLPATGAAPSEHQATARTSVKPSAQSFSYTFRRSPGGNVEWLGDMGSNGTIIFEQAAIQGQGSLFKKALHDVVEIDHENLDGARGVGIEVKEGVPAFKHLPSASQSTLALILLEPTSPPPAFYSYTPPSPWQSAVICTASKHAKLAASSETDFASCLKRIDGSSAYKVQRVISPTSASASTLALADDRHLIIYDPAPASNAVFSVEFDDDAPKAVYSGSGESEIPTFISQGSLKIRQSPSTSPGPLGAVLSMVKAERLLASQDQNFLICAPASTSVRSIPSDVEAPASNDHAIQHDHEQQVIGFWTRLAQSFKTFWTVYVLGIFFGQSESLADGPAADAAEDDDGDEDQTVVGERTPLLRELSPQKPAAASRGPTTSLSSLAFTFKTSAPFTFAISDAAKAETLRFEADGRSLEVSIAESGPSAAVLHVGAGLEGSDFEIIVSA